MFVIAVYHFNVFSNANKVNTYSTIILQGSSKYIASTNSSF